VLLSVYYYWEKTVDLKINVNQPGFHLKNLVFLTSLGLSFLKNGFILKDKAEPHLAPSAGSLEF
jgi:hypothetical protein